MKTMKKYLKVVLCFVAFVMCSFMFAFTPTFTTSALQDSYELYNLAIKSIQVPKTVEKGKPFEIPLLDSKMDGSTYKIQVVDPAGKTHTYNVDGTNDSDYFNDDDVATTKKVVVNAKNKGVYKVLYVVTDASGRSYYSNTYSVSVENTTYELGFKVNNKEQLVRPEVKTGTVVDVPVAYYKETGAEGEGTALSFANVKVTQNGNPASSDVFYSTGEGANKKYVINASKAAVYEITYTFAEAENRPTKTLTFKATDNFKAPEKLTVNTISVGTIQVGQTDIELPKLTVNNEYAKDVAHNVTKIEIKNKNNAAVKLTLTNNDYTFDMKYGTGHFAGADSYEDLIGDYEITYYFVDAYGNEDDYTTTIKNVSVSKEPTVYMAYTYDKQNFNAENVNTDYAADLKSSFGYDEIILPAVYAEDQVSTFGEIKLVRYLRKKGSSLRYYIDNVKYDESTGELVTVQYGQSGYNYALVNAGTTNAEKTKTGNSYEVTAFKFTSDDTKAAEYKGEYYLEYLAYSDVIKTRKGTLYMPGTQTQPSFEVLAKTTAVLDSEAVAPIVDIANWKSSVVRPDETISVDVTATDESKTDSRLKTVLFTYTAEKSAALVKTDLQDVVNTLKQSHTNDKNILLKVKDGMVAKGYTGFDFVVSESETKYDVDLKELYANGASQVTVVAASINDNKLVGTDEVVLTFEDITEDYAPTIEIIDGGDFTKEISNDGTNRVLGIDNTRKDIKIGEEVELPTVFFNDVDASNDNQYDSHLQMSVYYYIGELKNVGEFKSPAGKKFYGNTAIGGRIVAKEAGDYTVVYTATDAAGNSTVTYFTFTVEDTSKPVLAIKPTGTGITQSGNTITAEVGTTIDFSAKLYSSAGVELTDGTIEQPDIEEDGLAWEPSGNDGYSYTFIGVGSYKLIFNATNAKGISADEKVIYVNITKPVMEFNGTFNIQKSANVDEEVVLPYITAKNANSVEVKVTNPNGDEVAVSEVTKGEFTYWTFKTDDTLYGNYKVVYSAINNYETKTSETFTIKVGDNTNPEFHMNYETELAQDIVYNGSDIEYTMEVSKSNKKFVVKIKNGDETKTYDLGLRISDADDSDDTTDDSNMSWSTLTYELLGENVKAGETSGQYYITGKGEVTLQFTVEDLYDNIGTKEIKFNVVTKSETTTQNDTVVGIVLIVISLVVLAGVILFFALTGKKGGSSRGGNKKSAGSKEVSETKEVEVEKVEEDVKEVASEDAPKSGDVE